MSIWKKGKQSQVEHLKRISKLGSAKLKSDPAFHKEISRIGGKVVSKSYSHEYLSELGKRSRLRENKAIDEIKNEFAFVFQPFEVCDRIAVKDDKIYFIEVKKAGEKLKPKQEAFKKLAGDSFIVIISD